MRTKTYDLIKELLTDYPELRDSDKKLKLKIWKDHGVLEPTAYGWKFNEDRFMEFTADETIRRSRQMVQADHPELDASEKVKEYRQEIEKQKGTFVYREQTELI